MLPSRSPVSSIPSTEAHTTAALIPAQGHGRRLLRRLPHIQESIARIIEATVASGSHTNGPMVAALERRFAQLAGVADAVAVNSGSSALRAALEVLRLPPGSEVLVPAYTFVMTAYAVSDAFAVAADGALAKAGLVPVFVDVDPRTLTMDPDHARAAITERTAALIPVHMLGQMADMGALRRLARAHGLAVIDDAAQAHGARYRDTATGESWAAGAAGDLGCFSLSDVKNMGTFGADAGLVTVSLALAARDPDIGARLRAWRNTGRQGSRRYVHADWGIRARLDEYSAAECLAELDLLERWTARRQAIAARYTAALAGSAFRPPLAAIGRQHVYFSYMAQAPSERARLALEDALRAAGVEVGEAYSVAADQEVYRARRLPCRVASADVARAVAGLLTPIPCYPELEETEIERIEAVLASASHLV